jgi:serine/threonine protein kinase/WD40 repeat protein
MAGKEDKPEASPAEAIFSAALELPPDERQGYLAAACGDELELRKLVDALLRAHEAPAGFLPAEHGTMPTEARFALDVQPSVLTEQTGDCISHYKLIQKIGEGGCGVVYMAEQEEPVRRKVALKVIKLGMDTKQVVARFEAERQALALMDHTNIAKVLDAGATETGRPYFVMELVGGVKITDYCDQNQLTTRQRLDLFVQVCRAIQHAHQKGVIHRDIKPSNVLVGDQDGVPVPKVIDFGIAKATQGRLTDQTVFTAFEQFLGTPAYMSPEQAQLGSLDVDTRSDIYSLGVLLYELLTGKTPFDSKELLSAGLDNLRRTIQEGEPPTPSTRLKQQVAAQEGQNSGESKIKNQKSKIAADLDWIVMKCLEKDRARRYDTANGLAMDIERHLNNEPVIARPPSRFYELQKIVQRHRFGFAATASVIVALVFGTVATQLQVVRARRAESKEARNRLEAQQNLYKSLLGEARATRLARLVGFRERVFALLARAKALDVPERNVADLRREAAGCLGDFVGQSPVNFTDFGADIESACLNYSGELAAFALHDRSIQLRDTTSGKESARLVYTNGHLMALCFSRAGDRIFGVIEDLATNGSGRTTKDQIRVWSRNADGVWSEPVARTLPGASAGLFSAEQGVFDVIVEPSLNSTALDTNSVKFRLFNLSVGEFVPGYEIIECPASHRAFKISRDGKMLAVARKVPADSMKPLNFYEWSRGTNPKTVFTPELFSYAFSDDGKHVFVTSEQGGALYTLPNLEMVARLKELLAEASPVFGGGKLALAKIHQNRIRLWHLAKGETLAMLDDPDFASPTCFTSDGNSLLTTGSRHARLYRLSTPEKLELPSHSASVPGVTFSADGRRLASAAKDRSVRVNDAINGKVLWAANDLPGPGQCLSFSPNGKWLAVGIWEGYLVWIRDAETGRPVLELGPDSTRGLAITGKFETTNDGPTCSVQFSPDGRYLATAGYAPNGVRIYKIEEHRADQSPGSLEATLLTMAPGGTGLAFSPNSKSVAFSSCSHPYKIMDEHLFHWDFLSAAPPHPLGSLVSGGVESCSFTPDSRFLMSISKNGAVVTLDTKTGNSIASFDAWKPQPGQFVEATEFLALSPDGSKLAFSSRSRLGVEIRDQKTGTVLYSLPDESGTVYWLAWSPDSRRLAVSRDNGDVAIWDLEILERILKDLGLSH